MIKPLSKPKKAAIYGRFARLKRESKVPIGLSTLGDMVALEAQRDVIMQVRYRLNIITCISDKGEFKEAVTSLIFELAEGNDNQERSSC